MKILYVLTVLLCLSSCASVEEVKARDEKAFALLERDRGSIYEGTAKASARFLTAAALYADFADPILTDAQISEPRISGGYPGIAYAFCITVKVTGDVKPLSLSKFSGATENRYAIQMVAIKQDADGSWTYKGTASKTSSEFCAPKNPMKYPELERYLPGLIKKRPVYVPPEPSDVTKR